MANILQRCSVSDLDSCWYVGFVADIDIKILGVAPPGAGHAFPNSDTCVEGKVIYFRHVFFHVWCHPWMDDEMDGQTDAWMGHVKKLHEKWPQHPLLYVIIIIFEPCALNVEF